MKLKTLKIFGLKVAEWIETQNEEITQFPNYNDPNSTYAGNAKGEILVYTKKEQEELKEKDEQV